MTDFNAPAFESASKINIWGLSTKRLMVVYRTVGCAYDKDGKGCTMCNFAYYANKGIKENNILKQHQQILTILNESLRFKQFDLLTLGNFFNDNEISLTLRKHLLTPLSKIRSLKRILVESRLQYVTEEKLLNAKDYLRKNQILEYAFGYETYDEFVRNSVLNKGVLNHHLDEAFMLCKKTDVDLVAYILIKPQTFSEFEAIEDSVKAALTVLKKAQEYNVKARIAFEPVFVPENTELEKLFIKDDYTPPKLWTVIEVLKRTISNMGNYFKKGQLFVGLSDENLSRGRAPSNCVVCTERVRNAIQRFNGDQDIDRLLQQSCSCKIDWEESLRHHE